MGARALTSRQDPLLTWRREFPILRYTTYLVSNSLGAMPRSVRGRMEEYAKTWGTRGVRAWNEGWWDLPVTTGNIIAPLIGAGCGELSMHPNISLIQAILISAFNFTKKKCGVVLSDLEFPSVLYVYKTLAEAGGARLTIVKSEDGITIPTEKIIGAIDERTLLVPLSHVLFKSAYIQDVAAIAERARRFGAYVLLDAYHSVGTIPLDVRRLGVDVLMGGVLKWLCGGPGGAFLWIKPDLRPLLRPRITGWMAHPRPFRFEADMAYRDDAFRFLNGTPSIPALYAATEGPKIISQIGVRNIRRKSVRQTSLIIDRADSYGFNIRSPHDARQRGGTVTLDVPHAYEIAMELLRRNIIIDYREDAGIRIAPHFYTSDEEVLHVIDEIHSILDRKEYRRRSGQKSLVT